MLRQLFFVFSDVVVPVMGIVLISYIAGPKLKLDPRVLARTTYYIFVPALVFDIFSKAGIRADQAFRMVAYIGTVYIILALTAFAVGRLLGRPREIIGVYVLIAVFSNNGNFGLPLLEFRLGKEALVPGTFYMLALLLISFTIALTAVNWAKGRGMRAVFSVLKTPALLAFVPAAFFSMTGIPVPAFAARMTSLLGQASIPTMLIVLGLQLAEAGVPRISPDVCVAVAFRVIVAPVIAFILATPFGLTGLERTTGILQASMPAAVMTTVIAVENDILPEFVTHAVLFSTVAGFFTLTIVLSLV